MPIALAAAMVIGIFVGNRFSSRKYAADNDRKLNTILNLIADQYVDTVNIDDLSITAAARKVAAALKSQVRV